MLRCILSSFSSRIDSKCFRRQSYNVVCVEFQNSSTYLDNQMTIMLWCYRLAHSNFVYLQKLFYSLFRNNFFKKKFICEVCQLSKYNHIMYPTLFYETSKLFVIVHSDV